MRKFYITIAVLVVTMVGMAYLYFSNLHTKTSANDLALNAASSNAAIIFSFDDDKSFYEILSGQNLFQKVLGESKAAQLKNLKNSFGADSEISKTLSNQKIYVSILPGDEDKVNFLLTTQLKDGINTVQLLKYLAKKIKLEKDSGMVKLLFADSSVCFLGIKNSLILISNSPAPVKALLAKESADLVFADYIKSDGRSGKNTLANIYLNFSKTPQLLKNILNSNLTGELVVFNKQSAYAALSYNFSSDKLLFNGSTEISNQHNYYKLFSSVAEQNITITKILPVKTANYVTYGIKDYPGWHNNLLNWFKAINEKEGLEKAMETVNQKYRINLKQLFANNFNGQLMTFQLNTGEKFGAVSLNNGEKLSQQLLDLSAEYADDIRVFKDADLPYYLFGEPFRKFNRPFFTIIDNYLVMANNASSINSFLTSYGNNALLINTEAYTSFRDQLSSSATICFYVNNAQSANIFSRNLKSAYFKQYQSTNGFKSFDTFCYQLSGDNGKFLTNLLLYVKKDKIAVADSTVNKINR